MFDSLNQQLQKSPGELLHPGDLYDHVNVQFTSKVVQTVRMLHKG